MRWPSLLAAGLLLLVGCGGQPDGPPEVPAPKFSHYVAMGDSYTSAPYVPTTEVALGCLRSTGNYPSLVAERLRVPKFDDVSCGGADTTDFSHPQSKPQKVSIPPQYDALTKDTDLVTVGIGGNDFNMFFQLGYGCLGVDGTPASTCTALAPKAAPKLDAQIRKIGVRVRAALLEIKRRAPKATVVLVGYPRLAPTTGSCPDLLPVPTSALPRINTLVKQLDSSLGAAAKQAGTEFIDLYGPSEGHDVCSSKPWVNGVNTDIDRAAALHPFPEEQQAVAKLIEDAVG